MGACESLSNNDKLRQNNSFNEKKIGNNNNRLKNGINNVKIDGIKKTNTNEKGNKKIINNQNKDIKTNKSTTNEIKKKNSHSSQNEKQTENEQKLIRITFYDNNIEVFSRPYPKETKFESIINDLNKKCKSDEKYYDILNNELQYKIKNKILDLSKKINDYRDNEEEKNLYINIDIKGLRDISANCESYIYENIRVLGKIYFSPFELYIFNIFENIFRKTNISDEEIKSSDIENVTNITSFCNGINKLYLFGGEKNNNLINTFWIIDLKQLKIKKLDSNTPSRKDNSLIYIPKKYVFIIGGQNEKSVFYFDTYKEKFFTYSDLEDIFIKPALILIDNTFLYVFSNIENNLLISKTNLRKEAKWEKIIPIIPENLIVSQQNFGICKSNYNSIIFIGGNTVKDNNENENNIFEFNLNNNKIYQSINKYFYYDLPEKTFIPFNEQKYFLLPNNSKRELIIIYFDKKTNIIEEIKFENDIEKNYKYKSSNINQFRIIFKHSKLKDNNLNNTNNLIDNKENGCKVVFIDQKDEFFATDYFSNKDNFKEKIENDNKSSKTIDANLYKSAENEKIIQDAANLIFGKDIKKKNSKRNSPNKKNRLSIDGIKNDNQISIDIQLNSQSNRKNSIDEKNKLFFNTHDSDINQNNGNNENDDKNNKNENNNEKNI